MENVKVLACSAVLAFAGLARADGTGVGGGRVTTDERPSVAEGHCGHRDFVAESSSDYDGSGSGRRDDDPEGHQQPDPSEARARRDLDRTNCFPRQTYWEWVYQQKLLRIPHRSK